MSVWVVNILGFLALCIGAWLGRPRLARVISGLGVIYFLSLFILYILLLQSKFADFKAHSSIRHVGIEAAFAFEGFWQLLGSLILLQGMVPIALGFLLYFFIRWLVVPLQRERYF